jgi:hypothetical protein
LPSNEKEIIITDCLYKRLGIQDSIGVAQVIFNDIPMVVTGVIKTDYIEYDIISKISQGIANSYSDYKILNQYNIAIVLHKYKNFDHKETISLPKSNIVFHGWIFIFLLYCLYAYLVLLYFVCCA